MNRKMRKIHRSMGAVIALFVIVLSVTGILLNHTSDFKLDQRYFTYDWLLAHYGVAEREPDTVFRVDSHIVSQFGEQVFLDANPIVKEPARLLGAVSLEDTFVIATEQALLLFTQDGEFIEKMTSSVGIPPNIQNIGLYHGDPVVQTRAGLWRSDFLLEQWENLSLEGVGWSLASSMPQSVSDELNRYFYGKGISAERVVLDIHNGRLFGQYGVWLLDVVAILLVVLSITGIWMWLKRMAK